MRVCVCVCVYLRDRVRCVVSRQRSESIHCEESGRTGRPGLCIIRNGCTCKSRYKYARFDP